MQKNREIFGFLVRKAGGLSRKSRSVFCVALLSSVVLHACLISILYFHSRPLPDISIVSHAEAFPVFRVTLKGSEFEDHYEDSGESHVSSQKISRRDMDKSEFRKTRSFARMKTSSGGESSENALKDESRLHTSGPSLIYPSDSYGKNIPPRYPELARERGYEGLVLLTVLVSKTGKTLEVEIEKSSGHEILDKAARDAVVEWKFRPAMAGEEPVEERVRIPIRFALTD